jgi:hypothetical protein
MLSNPLLTYDIKTYLTSGWIEYRPELKSPLSNRVFSPKVNGHKSPWGQPIRFLEHVTATVSLKYTDNRGKVELTLVSHFWLPLSYVKTFHRTLLKVRFKLDLFRVQFRQVLLYFIKIYLTSGWMIYRPELKSPWQDRNYIGITKWYDKSFVIPKTLW